MAKNEDDPKQEKPSPGAGWRPVSAQLEALLAKEPVTQEPPPAAPVARATPVPASADSPADPAAPAPASEPRSTSSPEQKGSSSPKTISELTATSPAATSPAEAPRKSDRVRLLLAGLVGALLASVVFLTIELVRAPREAAPPPPNLVAVPALPRAPDADPDDPPGAPAQPGAPGQPGAGSGLGGLFGQLQQQMQQAMKGLGRMGGGPNTFSFRFGGDDADLDVREEPDAVIVVAKVKDAIAEKFDVQVSGRTFTLRGERRIGGGPMMGTMSFSKSVSLPADVDPSKMTSEVRDGALRVRLPKK